MIEQKLINTVKERLSAFSARDWATYKAGLTPDAVYVEMATERTARGADEVVKAVKGWTEAFPDVKATIDATFVCGNTVVTELTWTGTQTGALEGPFGTIPPSGKFGTVKAVQVVTFEGEKIKELHHYFNLLTILRSIGALPRPELATAR